MKITLQDIAKKTGVTPSTVQRALNGGGGVSEEKRALIQKTASEMGYRQNYYASSPKRERIRIAVVYPDTSSSNRFYSHYLWSGIEAYLNEANLPNLEMIPITYVRSPEDSSQCLQDILDGKYGAVDGVITRGTSAPEIVERLKRLQEREIPVILTGTDIRPKYRLCCIRSYEQMAGSLAADLLLSFGALESRTGVIVCGNFTGLNQFNNAQGFERELWDSRLNPHIMKISSDIDEDSTRKAFRDLLNSNSDVGAIYACSTRSTLAACNAVKEAGLAGKVRIIGSDLFEESVQMLREGVISAIIHNRPFTTAHRSIQVLANYLMNETEKPRDTILVNSAIVMKGNLDFYLHNIPALEKHADPEKLALYGEEL